VCRKLLGEDEDAHGDDEPTEGLAEDVGGDTAGESAADEAAGDRGGGNRGGEPPVDVHGVQVAGEAGEGLHRDDDEGGADRHRHGQAAEQREGGDDQEPAAGADESGHQTDDDALGDDLADRQFVRYWPAGRGAPAADHGDSGGEHHQREPGEQEAARNVGGDAATGVGAGHAGQPEDQAGAPADPSGAGVRQDGHGAGGADDEQRSGDGFLGR
jgi:hypothetical protein